MWCDLSCDFDHAGRDRTQTIELLKTIQLLKRELHQSRMSLSVNCHPSVPQGRNGSGVSACGCGHLTGSVQNLLVRFAAQFADQEGC